MDLDLSRAGGMSRLLRQGKASEHTLRWTGLRRHSAGWCLSLRGTKVPRSGCRAPRNVSPCAHVRERAASECDYACFGAQRTPPSGPARSSATIHTIGAATTLPGEQQTLRVGQSVGPICSSAQREKRSL